MFTDDLEVLDAPAAALATAVGAATAPVKPVLRGDWLGHAVHPLLTDVPIGTFTSAMLLDLLGGDEDAAALLIGIGLAVTPAVLATGWSDWHDEEARSPAIRRTGIVHAVVNVAGIGLQVASLAARRDGSRARGMALSGAALTLMGAAGWLGGHLTYAKGSRVQADGQRPVSAA